MPGLQPIKSMTNPLKTGLFLRTKILMIDPPTLKKNAYRHTYIVEVYVNIHHYMRLYRCFTAHLLGHCVFRYCGGYHVEC